MRDVSGQLALAAMRHPSHQSDPGEAHDDRDAGHDDCDDAVGARRLGVQVRDDRTEASCTRSISSGVSRAVTAPSATLPTSTGYSSGIARLGSSVSPIAIATGC